MTLTDRIKNSLLYRFRPFLIDHYPRFIIEHEWKQFSGHEIDWDNPLDLNEKIQWLICFSDTSQWTRLADKLKVRDFLKQKGYSHLLPKLLGVYKDANEIDYDALPDQFVLKCNHDCGSVHIIDKNNLYDKLFINSQLNNHLHRKFGYAQCEPHYNRISPHRIIAEEYLNLVEPGSFSDTIVDYKVWCFNGKPYSVMVLFNRTRDNVCMDLYDLNWRLQSEHLVFSNHFRKGNGLVPKPQMLDEMLAVAADLSNDFPEVRVDFYCSNNKLYFGEMTFTSAGGRMPYFTKDYLAETGNCVDLTIAPKKRSSFSMW